MVECGITSCKWGEKINDSYVKCTYPKNIVLKWRAAADLGRGAIVMVECLQLEVNRGD